ncbi:MAG: cohesin domain-containing protein [Candidatus Poribacteria bacterium]|nr:cohesin domain-containing protein [Candidatus Poribacteria bacterium]
MDRNLLGTQGMGFTWLAGKWGGNATINMNYIKEFPNHYLGLVAHELGHAFALDPGHNNVAESLNGRVVAWGNTTGEWGDRMRMLKEEAVLLDSRPIFRKINLQEDPPNVIAGEVPADMDTITYSQDLSNVNVLMYTGAVSWMSLDDANLQSQLTKQLLSSKGIRAEIVQTEDSVRDWMLQTTSDGNVDVLILYGVLPTSIHPYPNSQPDGTVAEEWIESTDGNTILNHGDYFGYVDNNGVQTLQDIMDIPHITMWDFGLENNTPMIVTKDGKEITPSLTNFQSDRAFHLDELTGDWFAEKVLASNTGTSQATRADPVIVRDGNRGRIGIVYQTFNEVNPKGKVVAELIANFLLRNNDKISLPPVEPIVGKGTGDLSDTVSLLPTSVQSPNIGQQLKLSLKIANGKNVAGYQATVSFDTTALRYVGSSNGDYLPSDAYVLSPVVTGNTLTLAATAFLGESHGDGTLAILTFEVVAVKASTVSLSDVLLTNGSGGSTIPQTENAEITEPTHTPQRLEDINKDGVVNIVDLTLVASNFGKSGKNAADVNADGVVNIIDLALVAAAFGGTDSAPGAWHPDLIGALTRSEVKQWLHQARRLDRRDPAFQRGLLILEQLLASLPPEETALLPNYPNPFNPETWIPYQLAKDAEVTLTIYTTDGYMVRRLVLGHQPAGLYENRNRAAYWDGKNELGEPVASGVYFYTLTAEDFAATRRMLILK